jgi:hypothetical protein
LTRHSRHLSTKFCYFRVLLALTSYVCSGFSLHYMATRLLGTFSSRSSFVAMPTFWACSRDEVRMGKYESRSRMKKSSHSIMTVAQQLLCGWVTPNAPGHTGMEPTETGKRVGAAVIHIPRFCGRTALRGLILSLTQMRQSSPGGWKEKTPSQSADGISRLRGRSPVAGRTYHLSPKLILTAVKIIPLLTTIVTQIALKEKDHPDPSAYSSWRHFTLPNSACKRSSKTDRH